MKNNKNKSIRFHYGMNAAILTVLFIVAVVFVNLLTAAISDRFPSINMDLSENGQFNLTHETKEVVSKLNRDVKITVVLNEDGTDSYYDEFLARYKELSGYISSTYVNPSKNPAAVKKYSDDIDPNGTFIIECGDRHEIIDATVIDGTNGRMADAESLMTNAIVSVYSDEKKYVAFSTGHGEGNFNGLKQIYSNKYFDVSDIDLKSSDEKKCDMLVIAAPTQDFTQQELMQIDSMTKKGTCVQILLNSEAQYLPNLSEYISEWGIEVKNEIVKENNVNNIYANYEGFVPVIVESDYTKNINNSYPMIYEPAYRLDIQYSGIKSTEITEILKTTEEATTITGETENTDRGSYVVAAVSKRVHDDNSTVEMFVSGSPLNLSYEYDVISGLPANKQLANLIISSFSGSKDYIEISSKTSQLKAFGLTLTQGIFIAIAVVIIAIAIIVFGFIVWRKRRFL